MIVIKVELWPNGLETNSKILGTAHISNDANGSLTVGNYDCTICDSLALEELGNIEKYKLLFYSKGVKKVWKECKVENFPRKRLLVWDLLYRALHKMIGNRNGE